MNVLTIKSVEKSEQTANRKNEIGNNVVLLPGDWWFSKLSFSHEKIENTTNFPNLVKTDVTKLKFIQNKHWTITKGDYFIKTENREKDYSYYRRLKERFIKMLFFPFIIISAYTIYIISEFLSGISF